MPIMFQLMQPTEGNTIQQSQAAAAAAVMLVQVVQVVGAKQQREVMPMGALFRFIVGQKVVLVQLKQQHHLHIFILQEVKGAVLDGRDIGTVVCPDADAKLFVTASVEVRAERRLKELLDRNVAAIHARVLQDMKERDARDSGRGVAPLVPAQDALQLDTSDLDADAVFAAALEFINRQNGS